MMRALCLALLSLVVIALAGCQGTTLRPPTGPGTSYPCGYTGVSCFDVDQTHTCCPERHACKTDSGGGYCESLGPDPGDLPPMERLRVPRAAELASIAP